MFTTRRRRVFVASKLANIRHTQNETASHKKGTLNVGLFIFTCF